MFFDTEEFIKRVESVFKSKLNDAITCINTAKNDWELDPIQDDAWFLQNLSDETFNYDPFVVYGLYDNPKMTDTIRGNGMKDVEIFVEVVVADSGVELRENVFYKLLRYSRALEIVANKNYDKIRSGVNIQVSALSPVGFELDGKRYRSAGIKLKAAISSM